MKEVGLGIRSVKDLRSMIFPKLAVLWLSSRDSTCAAPVDVRNGEMKSEKEQMTESRERSIVEIQFREIQRDQDSVPASPKVKEEKKEVFTKVSHKHYPASLECREPVTDMVASVSTIDSEILVVNSQRTSSLLTISWKHVEPFL